MTNIDFDYKKLLNNLNNLEKKSQINLLMRAEEGAKVFENHAKLNRPWRDRTGHARQRLKGSVDLLGDIVRINISHGVRYGIYLEFCHNKRYAILLPTVQTKALDVLELFKGFFSK